MLIFLRIQFKLTNINASINKYSKKFKMEVIHLKLMQDNAM